MAVIKQDYDEIGDKIIDPLVVYARGLNYCQFALKNEIIKQYKYVKAMDNTEYSAYLSPSVPYVAVVDTTLGFSYNSNGSSSPSGTISLTTTPIEISTLNLEDGKYSVVDKSAQGDRSFAVKFYNNN